MAELDHQSFSGRSGEGSVLEELVLSPQDLAPPDLVGKSAFRGFRRLLEPMTTGNVDVLAQRRLLWDLPLALMISMRSRVPSDPDTMEPQEMPDPLPGVNQCAGWQDGGEMVQVIRRQGGRLTMTPSPILVGDDHLGDPEPVTLVPFGTRRRRRLQVWFAGTDIVINDVQRDSYADEDGIEHSLHHWIVSATADSATNTLTKLDVSSGALPWVECPSAAGSAQRLVGLRFDELEHLVAAEFVGITTCTHLNDTLATLSAVPELLARLEN